MRLIDADKLKKRICTYSEDEVKTAFLVKEAVIGVIEREETVMVQDLKQIQEALAKQKPKKIVKKRELEGDWYTGDKKMHSQYGIVWRCRSCGFEVDGEEYCSSCGQALKY